MGRGFTATDKHISKRVYLKSKSTAWKLCILERILWLCSKKKTPPKTYSGGWFTAITLLRQSHHYRLIKLPFHSSPITIDPHPATPQPHPPPPPPPRCLQGNVLLKVSQAGAPRGWPSAYCRASGSFHPSKPRTLKRRKRKQRKTQTAKKPWQRQMDEVYSFPKKYIIKEDAGVKWGKAWPTETFMVWRAPLNTPCSIRFVSGSDLDFILSSFCLPGTGNSVIMFIVKPFIGY